MYFIFGCAGSLLLCKCFLWLWRARATLKLWCTDLWVLPGPGIKPAPLDHRGSPRPNLSITSVNPSLTLQVVSTFFLITVIILIIIVNIYGVLIIRHLTYIISFHFHKSKKCRDLISPFTDGETEAHMADKPKQCDSRACPELPCMVFPRYTGVVVPGARARPDALYCPASQLCTNQVKAHRCCC